MCKRGSSIGSTPAVLVALSLLFSSASHGQTGQEAGARTHYLGFLVGGGIASYREDLLVPISFDGPEFFLGGKYTAESERTCLQARLRMSVALLKNRFSHEAYAAALDLRPSWTKLMRGSGHNSQLWLGMALPMRMTNLFINSWDESHLYWLTTHSLAVVAEYRTRLPRLGNSTIRVDLPMFGLVSRPPEYRYRKQEPLNHFSYHFSAPNKAFSLKSIWRYQAPQLQIMIRRDSRGSLMNLGLELSLDHCSEPKPVWGLNTRLLFSYQWKVGGGGR